MARDLAALTGESITEAVVASLEDRLATERRRRDVHDLRDSTDRFQSLPTIDPRDADEILGYDDHGLPT